MSGSHENALAPASLATDGEQGESATGQARYRANDTASAVSARAAARLALEDARRFLDVVADATEAPIPGTVEAADWLDLARTALDGSP